MEKSFDTLLKGGRLIDPAQGIDRFTDLGIKNGRIAAIGDGLGSDAAEVVDVTGLIVIPGMVDLHCHVYGFLGFAYPDRVGIRQGVTTFVEPGGPGVFTYEEFDVLTRNTTITNLYAGALLDPIGMTGLEVAGKGLRSIGDIPVNRWLDLAERYRDSFRYLKIGAFADLGPGYLHLGRGMADILDVPLYVHIGDFMTVPERVTTSKALQLVEAGDIVTHIYHGNPGNILEDEGKVLAHVKAAERRGVLFDIGFGSFNFSFDVAERAFARGVVPHIISSDLQQINVTGPAYSLANVMSILRLIGLSIPEIVARVTINPAKALAIDDRVGSLHIGRAADVTVLKVEDGEFVYADCAGKSRTGQQRLLPVMVYKDGKAYEIDMETAQEERNWHMQISEDAVPAAAKRLNEEQREFLAELGTELKTVRWDSSAAIDMEMILNLHRGFHDVQSRTGILLKDALVALYSCFTEEPCSYQAGLFLLRNERAFVLDRLSAVSDIRRRQIA